MEDYDFDFARAKLLESKQDLEGAAEVHLLEGRVSEAIELFTQDKKNESSIRRANECILEGLWQNISLGSPLASVQASEAVSQLLDSAGQVDAAMLEPNERDEVWDVVMPMVAGLNTLSRYPCSEQYHPTTCAS